MDQMSPQDPQGRQQGDPLGRGGLKEGNGETEGVNHTLKSVRGQERGEKRGIAIKKKNF